MRQVEELRSAETEKWLAFYDAQATVDRAELEVLRQTGTITGRITIAASAYFDFVGTAPLQSSVTG